MTTREELDQALLDLRRRGLSYHALAAVADYVYGWRLPPEHIRRRLRHFGVQPDPTRARYGEQNPMALRLQVPRSEGRC